MWNETTEGVIATIRAILMNENSTDQPLRALSKCGSGSVYNMPQCLSCEKYGALKGQGRDLADDLTRPRNQARNRAFVKSENSTN